MKGERTSRAGVICSGCAVTLLLAPAALDVAPAASGFAADHDRLAIAACSSCTDPVDQDREPGKDLVRACDRTSAVHLGPVLGRPDSAPFSIRATRRHLYMIAPKQGPPVPPAA